MQTHKTAICFTLAAASAGIAAIVLVPSPARAVIIGPDAFGYVATNDFSYNPAAFSGTPTTPVFKNAGNLTDNDDGSALIPLGFSFTFYGASYSEVHLSVNGLISFGDTNGKYINQNLQSTSLTAPAIAPLWDDWETNVDANSRVSYQTLGSAGNRRFLVQWSGVYGYGSPESDPETFEAVLYEGTNRIDFNYSDVTGDTDNPVPGDIGNRSYGAGATVGITKELGPSTGNVLQWSHNSPVIAAGRTISFYPPTSLPPAVSPPAYSLKSVIDNTNPAYTDGVPTLNDAGAVVYQREGRAVITTDGGPATTIEDDSGPRAQFNSPAINAGGSVSFHAVTDTGGSGIYVGAGGPITKIADNAGDFNNTFGTVTEINVGGTVVFHAGLDIGGQGIFKGNGGEPTAIATTNAPSPFSSLGNVPSINDGGIVAFSGTHNTDGQGIFTGSGGVTTTIAKANGTPLNSLGQPDINSAGTVAFFGALDAGGEGIFTSDGGPITTIADSTGPYSDFTQPSINDAGMVAFMAKLDGETTFGIYAGSDPVADKVIRTGDLLHGALVTDLQFVRGGLNNIGEIAFRYTLANGVKGIAVAVPTLPGDYDRDGDVDGDDFLDWQRSLGSSFNLAADGGGNGLIDEADLTVWKSHFGQTSVVASTLRSNAPVPEPGMLLLGGLAVAGFRRLGKRVTAR